MGDRDLQRDRLAAAPRIADGVWVFNGDEGRFAGGIFTSRDLAERWIADRRLSAF